MFSKSSLITLDFLPFEEIKLQMIITYHTLKYIYSTGY